MRNHEVTTTQPLLGPDGILQEPGWSRRPLQLYSRADIKKRPTRIKEWDYYSVLSPSGDFGVCFTLSDDGYIGLQITITWPLRLMTLHFSHIGFTDGLTFIF